MNKLNRWVAENAWVVYITGCVLSAAITGVLTNLLQLGQLLWYILFLFLTYCINLWVFGRSNVLLHESMKPLSQGCDPFPMVEEARLQLHYPAPKNGKLVRRSNYALALQHAGEYEEALQILLQMPVHKTFGIYAPFKTVYYNNLMSLYVQLNQPDKAVEAYDQMLHYYGKIKIPKHRKQLAHIIAGKKAVFHFCRKEYALALAVPFPAPRNLLDKVLNARFLARVYLAMGDLEQAKEQLEFVVQNGNKLYIATEAKALLEKINLEEQ